jgi:hypothetical protein
LNRRNNINPSWVQRPWAWLRRTLARNASTVFGRQHAFDKIHSPREYQERIPLMTYENLAPWVDAIARGEQNILFSGPAIAFEMTGGSHAGPKRIPYSQESLDDFRDAVGPWLNRLLANTKVSGGRTYWATSHRDSGTAPSGAPVGLPEVAYLGKEWETRLLSLSAVPAWVGELSTPQEWRIATLYWLLRAEDLALVWVWSPTFILSLIKDLDACFLFLHSLLTRGGDLAGHPVPADPDALNRLQKFKESQDVQTLWPRLALISAWASASSQPFAEELKRRFPRAVFEPKGLLLTEGVVTVPDQEGRTILAVDQGFFEFLDDKGRARLAHEIGIEEEYEVVLTTSGGLYRYRTGDRVLCQGLSPNGPELSFLGRGNLTSDLVGEKLTDAFVAGCLNGIPGFRMLVPTRDPSPGYVLVVDSAPEICADQLEKRLHQNPPYAHARRHHQLAPVRLLRTIDPLKTYVDRRVAGGVRRGDVKVLSLHAETDWVPSFQGVRP